MNDFNEIAIFATVAQQKGFTRAAAALKISKAAVSRSVTSLESRLGSRLFERTTRRLRITEAGEAFLFHAKLAVQEGQLAEVAVSRLSERPRGMLRVVLPVTLAQASVAPKLASFLATYPELAIDLQLKGGQNDPIGQNVDVIFQTSRPVKDSQLIQKRIVTVPMGLYASPQYLAGSGTLRSPEDLTQHSCLTAKDSSDGMMTWHLWKDNKEYEVRVRGRVSVGDPIVQHRLCVDGAGVAILPKWLVTREATDGSLTNVLSEYAPTPIELYMIYPTRLSMTPKLKVFVAFIKSVVPGILSR
jgi:DNA-binding transcriptional LysR family regulator